MTATIATPAHSPQHDAPPKRGIVLPAALIGIGALLLGLTALFPTVILNGVKKTPLDGARTESIAQGTGKIFDSETGKLVTYDDVTASRFVTVDTDASDSDVAVFVQTLCVRKVAEPAAENNCDPTLDPDTINVDYDRVGTDRVTGLAVNDAKYKETKTEGEVDGTKHEGLTYKFPFDVTTDGDYQMFNADTGGTTKAEYQGTEDIQGLTVYKFVADFGEHDTKIQQTFPGTIHNVITYWVEPTTGIIVKGNQKQTQTFENGDLAAEVDLTFTQETIDKNVEKANESISKLDLVKLWAPLGAGVIGLALVVGGILLLSKRRESDEPRDPYADPA